jgi:glucokinase
MLVVGDIGGTKTLLALFEPGADVLRPVAEKEYHSASYPGLDAIVREFLAEVGRRAEFGCFDVAGPVVEGRIHTTNLPWTMDEAGLARACGLKRVILLNDLQAIAIAIPHLGPGDLTTLSAGDAEPNGALAVIAPGTGLGEAFLAWNGTRYLACASEGGHASFSPANARQAELWRFLQQRLGHVSFERVCSGRGIGNLYDFLRGSGAAAEPDAFAAELAKADDRTPLITEAGLHDAAANPLAAATLALFVEILAGEAGNLALKVLATGGVYLAGGMPARVLPLLAGGKFMPAFCDKGRLAEVLRRMPVHVVTAPAALLGAARHGLDQMAAG